MSAPDTAPTKSKAAGLYMICTLSKHAAENAGYADALMLDWRGQIAEATGANIFLVQDGKVHTPTPDCFLDGITRRSVVDLARKAGITVIERAIMPDELAHTQEVFITGTAAEVTPVAEIGPKFERHPAFPRRVNAHFVKVHSPAEVTMRTWERGSGITLACGTGACAVCVAGVLSGRTARKLLAHLPGGDLELHWSEADNCVYMTGPATEVFSGEWPD